jgi:hypothetical protein
MALARMDKLVKKLMSNPAFTVTVPYNINYQIFDENQNPVDMHTSIMCINILQNIKAVAPKL